MGGRQPRALSDPNYTLSCSLVALAIPPRCASTFSPYRIVIRVFFHRLLTARTISDQCSVETNQIRIVGHRYAFIGPVEA
jgi:hypothetical protein